MRKLKIIPLRRHRSSVFFPLVLLLTSVAWMFAGNQLPTNDGQLVHLRPSMADELLNCARRVYEKPVLKDASVDQRLLINPCPHSRAQLSAALASQGIRVFESDDFIFLIPAKFFPPRPSDLSPYIPTLTWQSMKIVPAVRPSPEISKGLVGEIERQVLQHARLIPLEVSLVPVKGNEIEIKINMYILVGRLAANGAKPIVAWINGLPTFLTGRLVYGEIRNDQLTMLWDSPLFNSYGQVYFQDVNGDGWQEIVIQSQDCGNQCSDAIVVFDKSGRELTRQTQFDRFAEAFSEEDGVSAIKGREISLEQTGKGVSEIVVHHWSVDNKNHVFRLENNVFVPVTR
jgi:hypothetical protein